MKFWERKVCGMTFTKSELLERLREEISAQEWHGLKSDGETPISSFNRSVLLELREAHISREGDVQEARVEGLYNALKDFLGEHLKDKPDGWKWIFISCLYRTFIEERPMHPEDAVGIKVSQADGKTVYECPMKSSKKGSVCSYCVCKRMSNYEIMKRQMQKEFVKYPQEQMIGKFGLQSDGDYIYIRFISRPYRIGRVSGEVRWLDERSGNWEEADYNEAMTIYDVLCYSKENCALAGEFVNMKSLSSIQGGSMSVGSGLFQDTEKLFDHREGELAAACEKLNGTKWGKGDVAYQLPMFDFMPIGIQFWNSDEDFPASLQWFVDKNMVDYMHFETVWFALSHLLRRIKEEMGGNLET